MKDAPTTQSVQKDYKTTRKSSIRCQRQCGSREGA